MRFIFTKFKYIYMYKWQNFCFFEYFWNAHRKIYIVSSKRISPIANECKVRFAFANPLNFACQQPLPKPDILPRSTEQGRFQEGGCMCPKSLTIPQITSFETCQMPFWNRNFRLILSQSKVFLNPTFIDGHAWVILYIQFKVHMLARV